MARYRLTIAYDGTNFHGWQRQYAVINPNKPVAPIQDLGTIAPSDSTTYPGGNPVEITPTDETRQEADRPELRTVQQVVQRAIRETVREPVIVAGASRTDAGVHAWGQTAAFTASEGRRGAPDDRLVEAINARLPDDVLVRDCRLVHDEFDPIRDCLGKTYHYSLHMARARPLLNRHFVHHVYVPLNIANMKDAAARLVGEHDFAAFAAAGHGRENTVRTIYACNVVQMNERVEIHVSGNGFLWNMVRIIAGTLVDVGRSRFRPEDVTRALESRDRRLAGPTLPASGLCLMRGWYPGDDAAGAEALGSPMTKDGPDVDDGAVQ